MNASRIFLIIFLFIISAENPLAKIRIGDPAPDFTLKDVSSGEQVSLSSYKGQIIVLRIWKVCKGICRINVPVLNRLHSEYSQKELESKPEVKIISVNAIDHKKRILTEIEKMEVKYQVLMGRNSGITSDYQTVTLPQIFIIDKDGIIRFNDAYPTYEELKEAISKLLMVE